MQTSLNKSIENTRTRLYSVNEIVRNELKIRSIDNKSIASHQLI